MNNDQTQQGSGSSENKGGMREEQMNKMTETSRQERSNIASQMGKGPNPLTDIKEMGGKSGRDDASGGSGDRMEEQSTRQETDR
jgi:hypothetical protein